MTIRRSDANSANTQVSISHRLKLPRSHIDALAAHAARLREDPEYLAQKRRKAAFVGGLTRRRNIPVTLPRVGFAEGGDAAAPTEAGRDE
ncbi:MULTISPECIES: hypothetical protein [unclassified Chelatococcus]|uniref:hypothetical protein n=1 Tax=unclassified Chelatococcus TaxID=2638111 RepID=UPI00031A0A6A|nr:MULTISPECIES: hypothetical protein [unclassified Chelatococcus]ALA16099.1 hypothetical protein AL346_00185 [Chelatococcus sp. CO-6]